ncbi:hypothetical protein BaRGS_00012668 [Batillaria attramentaria]|uniref:Uncharacterized protein n=1 Tax=Batillaria attramentaria TaxID=370345 RepID=A0ABD0L999_9CAEN
MDNHPTLPGVTSSVPLSLFVSNPAPKRVINSFSSDYVISASKKQQLQDSILSWKRLSSSPCSPRHKSPTISARRPNTALGQPGL